VLNAVCEPRPEPVPPILLGAVKPRMLRLAATYADEWDVSSTRACLTNRP
jgi:alkanesulfonate monooxygenase SsuD/methylene tetrahydromethanopterin reductase-like flavin-dependent oxidoreductase (luciferase family)